MGFNFAFGKKQKIGKYIGAYVSDRVKEKQSYEKQLTRLEAQLKAKTIDQQVYERFRNLLEIKFIQTREEARKEIQNIFQKRLSPKPKIGGF